MSELPEGVDSVTYLRDGWPDVVVCKVKMKTEHVGIGVFRARGVKFSPSSMDHLAFKDAMVNMGLSRPDYTEVQEYLARQKSAPAPSSSLPSGESDPAVTSGCAGAGTK